MRQVQRHTTFEEFRQELPYFRRVTTVFDLPLQQCAIHGAKLDSVDRRPFPECYPGTRTTIIEEIRQWATGEDTESTELLWVYGPAGAGKTAIAQTIGESMDDAGVFLAGFFFSRPRKHHDPSRFWPSICHQITFRNEKFKEFIDNTFDDTDWEVLEKDIQSQFDELIKEPLSTLLPEESPRIIIIDGLDECEGEEGQCKIIKCILDVLRSPSTHLGVRWLIFSRPEPHLKRVFETAESEGLCCTKEVLVDGLETQMDVRIYLAAEFTRIANTYRSILGAVGTWPKQNDLEKIFKAASGFFVYAVTIVKFIGDHIHRDPVSRLQLVIDVIDGSPIPPGGSHPLGFIDNLYRELIERTPPSILETTLRILGMCIVCPHLPVIYFAHLLGIELEELYDALIFLPSVIDIPSEAEAAEESLRFFHASFPDFLMDSERSGRFAQDVGLHRLQLVEKCFRVLENSEISYAEGMDQSLSESRVDITDDDDERILPSPLSMAYVILNFASTHVWEICTRLHSPSPDFLRRTVDSFDFRRLQFVCESIPPQGFVGFLRWLDRSAQKLHSLTNIVRSCACSDRDSQLIEAYAPVSQPLVMNSRDIANHLEEAPRWVVIGFGDKTVAVLITHETVMAYVTEDIELPPMESESFSLPAITLSRLPSGPNSRPFSKMTIRTSKSTSISKRTRYESKTPPQIISTLSQPSLVTDYYVESPQYPESSDVPLSRSLCDCRDDDTTIQSSFTIPQVGRQSAGRGLVPPAPKPFNRPPPSLLRPSQPTTALTLSDHMAAWST